MSTVSKVLRLDLARAIASRLELTNARLVNVEGNHWRTVLCEGDSNRQTNIAETDYCKLSSVRHDLQQTVTPGAAFSLKDHQAIIIAAVTWCASAASQC